MSIPYFYIIQNNENGKYYVGSRTSMNANPKELLMENGYITSSILVKNLIQQGIVFKIRKVKTFDDKFDALNYETKFLHKVDAKNNENFYNQCNNVPEKFIFSEEVFLLKYGVSNPSQLLETQEKIKETSRKNRGVEHHLSDPKVIQKRKETVKRHYGVEHISQVNDVKEAVKKTMFERYGSRNNIEKIKKTNMEKYGVENVGRVPEIATKRGKSISKTKQSDEWKPKKEMARAKLSKTLNSKEWIETKGKSKSDLLREHALNRPKLTCPYCRKKVDSSNYARWHGNKCKFK